jgi:hypothetical protein
LLGHTVLFETTSLQRLLQLEHQPKSNESEHHVTKTIPINVKLRYLHNFGLETQVNETF